MHDDQDSAADNGLWPALIQGRPEAFAMLMDRHGARLLAHALAVSGDRTLAEDAVQDVLLSLVQRPALLAAIDHPAAYVARMVRNRAIDLARRQPPCLPDGKDLAFVSSSPDQSPEQTTRINTALAQLPAEQREVVALKVFHGLTFAAIAEATDTTLNTAASRYRYALEKLTALLKDLRHDA